MTLNPDLKTKKGVILFLVGLFFPALFYWTVTNYTTLTRIIRDDNAYYILFFSAVVSLTFWIIFQMPKRLGFCICGTLGGIAVIISVLEISIANYGFQRILYPTALITEEGNTFSTRIELPYNDKPIYVDKDQLAPGQVLSEKTPFYQYCVGRTRHGTFYCSTPRLTKQILMIDGTESPYYVVKVLPDNFQPKFSDDAY